MRLDEIESAMPVANRTVSYSIREEKVLSAGPSAPVREPAGPSGCTTGLRWMSCTRCILVFMPYVTSYISGLCADVEMRAMSPILLTEDGTKQ